MALRRVPADRYPTAAALGEDLERHLADEPVRARPPALSYRAHKFVRRHRLGVSAIALVALVVIAGIGGVFWQSRETRRQAEKAAAVTDFMTRLFDVASPSILKGEGITARMMLDRASGRIDEELAGQPEVQAEVLNILGRFYDRIGAYDEAESLLSRSVRIQRDLGQARGELFAETLAWLGTVHQTRGRMPAAEPLFREAVRVARTTIETGNPAVAHRLNDLAVFLHNKGENAEAEVLHREILASLRR